jgi:hypothetical protein
LNLTPTPPRSAPIRTLPALIAAATLAAACVFAHAQAVVLRIDPSRTDPAIRTVRGPHLALYDPHVTSLHRLLLFLPGTNGRPEGSLAFDTAFTQWGFHAITLDYENGVQAASCSPSPDPSCFDHYRETIITGAPGSERIAVTPANSIVNRFARLLTYLAQTDPDGQWADFLDAGQPRWDRIVVAGHSQGAGHAAYLGKLFRVDRVLMFSGPQDYAIVLNGPASWESRPSLTPPRRFFAFLSQRDPFHVEHQIESCAVLMHLKKPAVEKVAPGTPIQGTPQILVNDLPGDAHGATIKPVFASVWQYMATTPVN